MEALLDDPKDYYGSYYGTRDFGVEKIDINGSSIKFRFEQVLSEAVEDTYQYCYVPAAFAKLYLDQECDALLV